MTQPARQNHQTLIFAKQRQQIWVVLVLIVIGVLAEMAWGSLNTLTTAKSMTAGALLAFLGNLIFTRIAYRLTGAKARQAIMLNMYLGQLLKWALTLVGFAMIFLCIKPINALMVFVGFCALQLWHTFSMWRI